ncbi:sialidase family protein [Acinetobacter vivianii]|uniref:exo-alpha-sialidase n=1 Tax=Acinetobacter vivianii TaxID=1776742 RepID=UPI002DBA3A39|nr:exo-alpha-sialidase [Acinetobacter vivianii]MEB6481358.1 exo-alpha-sialidase [Acinetobacter vivianii]MEB6659642.1 exo-alpha-sialidase [Acinetobacter vivianii]
MNKLELILKSGATLLFCVLLQACATTPQSREMNALAKDVLEPVEQEEKLYPVILSVGFNSGMNFPYLLIESLSEKTMIRKNNKTYKINVINTDVSRSTLIYSGKLPVGEYRIVELNTFVPSANPMLNGKTKFIKLDDQNKANYIGTFKVVEDTTTDLGRMFLTHANDAYIFSRSENYSSNKELMAKFGDKYLQAIYKDKVLTGWTQPITAIEKYFGNESKLLPFGMQCFKETQDNRVVAASKIGAIFSFSLDNDIKDKNEKAKILRSKNGLAFDCLTTKQNSSFDFLAYGEMNNLYKHQKGSDGLIPVDTGNLPIGIIAYIVGDDQQGWYLAHVVGAHLTIYRSDRLEKGDWKPFLTKKIFDVWLGLNGFWMWEDEHGFDYADIYGNINRYDYATKQWSQHKVPDNANITQLFVNPDQSFSLITSKGGFAGVFAKQFNSKDHGATWQKIDSPFKVNIWPAQVSTQGDMYIASGPFSWGELAVKEQGSPVWEKRKIIPQSYITVLSSGTILNSYFSPSFAVVGSSKDKGKTWTPVYSTYNSKLEELYKKQGAAVKK